MHVDNNHIVKEIEVKFKISSSGLPANYVCFKITFEYIFFYNSKNLKIKYE